MLPHKAQKFKSFRRRIDVELFGAVLCIIRYICICFKTSCIGKNNAYSDGKLLIFCR
nr:MAG TPA: hypothetical protein [Caudoviricetes sp.]